MNVFETQIIGNCAVINLERNVIGGADALEFSSHINVLAAQDIRRIVINLTNVELINSSGLGMLVQGLTLLKKIGGAFVLASVPDRVLKQLEITRLNTIFTVFPTIESAISDK